jgi:hypothetical protein
MRKTMLRALVAASALFLASGTAARADETTFCNTRITTLPYTIATQGHYCLDRNLSTAIATGNAITINSDFVLLDLNNFKLGGGSAGPTTSAVGVYAIDRSNLTIRNGNIRGFAFGIHITGATPTTAQNIVIENNALDGNLVGGISVHGNAYVIRNNLVTNTGGGTSTTTQHCGVGVQSLTVGISDLKVGPSCVPGGRGEIIGNTVVNMLATIGGTNGAKSIVGINGLIIQNRIMTSAVDQNDSIVGAVCRDNTALDVFTSSSSVYTCDAMVGINSEN